ncbi:MAG: TIGR00730 family Rossman fold protein [Acidobacteriota bacterium]
MTASPPLASSAPKRVAIFCGSRHGRRPAYARAAVAVGTELAARGIGVVYGGGNVGLMGVLADAALAGGGDVIGVIPESLMAKELGHGGVTQLHVVTSMHERKALMADLSDAFLALPGGFGTYEEILEITTWAQLGLHAKPFGLLDIEGFYQPLLAQFERAVDDGFIEPAQRELLLVEQNAETMVERLLTHRPQHFDRWLERSER